MTTTSERLEQELAHAREAPTEPCVRCGVRADVGCKHRQPTGLPPIAIADQSRKRDGRTRPASGQGWSFRNDRFGPAVEEARERLAPVRKD